MTLAELDWNEVLRMVPVWDALSPAARFGALAVKPGPATPPGALGSAVDELVAAGIVVAPGPRGTNYPQGPGMRPFLTAFRAMDRLRPLDGPGGRLAPEYLRDQCRNAEVLALAGAGDHYGWADPRLSADLVSSVEWVKSFLAASTGALAERWERGHMLSGDPARLKDPPVAMALRALVQALADAGTSRPLSALPQLLPRADPAVRAAALAAGLRYMLVFVSLQGDDQDAVVGLLPCVARRLGPPAPPPAPVAVTAWFEAAFRVDDMTAVLVEAMAEPIPVRGADRGMYVRAQKAIAARLVPLPPWVARWESTDDPGAEPGGAMHAPDPDAVAEVRLAYAADLLERMKLAAVKTAGDRFHFVPSPAGRAWVEKPEGERLKQVLATLRGSSRKSPGGIYSAESGPDFFGVRLAFAADRGGPDLRAALAAAFLSQPEGQAVEVEGFARYLAENANPMLDEGFQRAHGRDRFGGMPRTREGWESMWRWLLTSFLRLRLVPLGGARLGMSAAGPAFTLTPAGRYLLGAADDFAYALQPEGKVLVQPDFEIVFLAAAPRVEAVLARFADRQGAGVGALFRITKASVLRAAEQGMTADRLLRTLAEVSGPPVPPNVARQVRDWLGAARRVRIRPAMLVECPDADTAARVKGFGGSNATLVTRTLLRLDGDAKVRSALVKKLRANGIFVDA